jgi:hypothetical protein
VEEARLAKAQVTGEEAPAENAEGGSESDGEATSISAGEEESPTATSSLTATKRYSEAVKLLQATVRSLPCSRTSLLCGMHYTLLLLLLLLILF